MVPTLTDYICDGKPRLSFIPVITRKPPRLDVVYVADDAYLTRFVN